MATLTQKQTAVAPAWTRVLATSNDYAATVSRLALGAMILPHGMQKALGLFGGYGFAGTMQFFTQTMHIPAPFAALAIAAEFLGGLGLITGLFGRVAAFGVGFTMLMAALTVHLPNGFFMNWFGNQKGEGVEFFILAIGLAVAVMIKGSGALSLDRLVANKE
ncbi:MAG: Membrane protein 2, distant similarity to thiosulfate:quinone oxidoreductase DoxD [Cyanobacteria bacterium RYN_339]|nr:Membrane protein 2, distant similarity to thiosulfate:quinone oxidoreductase DoxD [Cyanobacteria bacterium RYN_339]